MANIYNLQMAKSICADSRISIRKSFFGLRTNVVYNPTGSEVDVKTIEYAPDAGRQWKHLLGQPRTDLLSSLSDFHPQPTMNGNYMLEVCVSRDGEFVALQLLQFEQLGYEPVSDVLTFEGEEARALAAIL